MKTSPPLQARELDSGVPGGAPSPLDIVLTEPGSAFDDPDRLRRAEGPATGEIRAVAQALAG